MIIKLLTIFIAISAVIFPQEKYFVYFKDKGIQANQKLAKQSEHYQEAVNQLSDRAIERRKKNLGDDFITYDDVPIRKEYIEQIEELGIKIIHELKWFNSISVKLGANQIAVIKNLPFVEKIISVKKISFRSDFYPTSIFEKPNVTHNYGPSFSQLNLSEVPFVHSKGISGEGVIVGLLDTGFDWKTHESLRNNSVIAEYDFIFNDSTTADEPEDFSGQHSHGTYVFSVVGGFKDSTLIGAAYNSSFVLAKTEDIRSETHIEEDNYAAALIWMEGLGVDITSSSLGYNIFDNSTFSYTYNEMNGKTTIVTKALDLAYQRGVSTFTSAGNEGNDPWFHIIAPADAFNVISVGAVNSEGLLASFSSRGPTSDGRIKPEIVTQGVSVYGASAGTINGYRFASGTSSAAPIASGIGALLLSAHPHLKNSQIRSIILESSSNSSEPNNEIGYGLLSAKNAIEFPNLIEKNGLYEIQKILFQERVVPSSAVLNYSIDGKNYVQLNLSNNSLFYYNSELPLFSNGQAVEFYFTYSDSSNNSYRQPAAQNYKLIYGNLDVSLNLEIKIVFDDYIVSEAYPNPFIPGTSKYLRINYKSPGNEQLKAVIIDAAGQKVKDISLLTNGNSFLEWDGYSDHGYLCSSGVYFVLIKLGSKEYGRKIVFLK